MRGVRMPVIAAGLLLGLGLAGGSVSGQVVTTGTGATGTWVRGDLTGGWSRTFTIPAGARAFKSFRVWTLGALGDIAPFFSYAWLDGPTGAYSNVFRGDGFDFYEDVLVSAGDRWSFGFRYIDCLDRGSCWQPGDPNCLYLTRCQVTREDLWDSRPAALIADDGQLAYTATFTTTPEPTSLLLFGPAAALLALIRRRRRRS